MLAAIPMTLVTRLEKAFAQVATIEPLLKKLNKADFSRQYNFFERVQLALQAGILTSEEAQQLE